MALVSTSHVTQVQNQLPQPTQSSVPQSSLPGQGVPPPPPPPQHNPLRALSLTFSRSPSVRPLSITLARGRSRMLLVFGLLRVLAPACLWCPLPPVSAMGWLQSVASIKLYVSFAKEPYKRDAILQKRPIISSILCYLSCLVSLLRVFRACADSRQER